LFVFTLSLEFKVRKDADKKGAEFKKIDEQTTRGRRKDRSEWKKNFHRGRRGEKRLIRRGEGNKQKGSQAIRVMFPTVPEKPYICLSEAI